MIDCNVPERNSAWSGTGTVVLELSVRFCMTMWEPRRRTSTKPCCARIRQTWRPESARSLPNGNFQARDKDLGMQALGDLRWIGGFEEQFERFHEVIARLLDRASLARDIQFRAQRDIAVALALDDGS